ncbi:MAG TPA: 3-hydroxyacyl-CoA dehydrogenase NAD-binding domain-containing protein [Verrucomicrobiales bacterium]|nr:3-hydroxyacyl-CoA dehydrogenase NAD-binding domain-containing protein [Verrucomicrobiales bacterium]
MANLSLDTNGSIARIEFDRPNSSANVFDRPALEELDQALSQVEANAALRGLVLSSAKPSIFIAGADLETLADADAVQMRELILLGQRVFNRLADLAVPAVAAIHGACVGGGCELALACDWRVASDDAKTRIGLPETQLGILPAWGGSTRLPKRIGLPAALGIILPGKILRAGAARSVGLVDDVVPRERLVDYAEKLVSRGKRKQRRFPLLHNPLAAALIQSRARRDVLTRTRGLYPAPLKALQVVSRAVTSSREKSLSRELEAVTELAARPETRRLIGLFFLRERARKRKIPGGTPLKISRAAVIGAGVMGSGIAYWLSTKRIEVLLQDIDPAAVARGMASIEKLYAEGRKRKVFDAVSAARGLDRIQTTAEQAPLTSRQLVIEAAVEDLAIKKKIFAGLARRCAPETILATNTSALPVRELAAVIDHPERLVGLHFFNPVHRLDLVEVVRAEQTSAGTLATAVAFVQDIGKLPVVVADRPGFLVNRILVPYLVAAAERFEQGTEPEAIDRAMLDFGMPMGPLRLLDEVGLDVGGHVAHTLAAAFPDRMRVPEILETMTKRGWLGRKTGIGFYRYQNGKAIGPNPDLLALRQGKADADGLAPELTGLMIREAQRCLDEGVAESAEDIDLAMVTGTGFAPFRGGPLRYAQDAKLSSRSFYPD